MILEDPPHYNLVHHCTDAIGHLMCISVLPVALWEVFDGEWSEWDEYESAKANQYACLSQQMNFFKLNKMV